MNGMVNEKTLEIASYVKVEAFGPYETVHFFDTGKFFGSRKEYNQWLAGVEKKEAAKKAKEAPKKAPETALVASSDDTPEDDDGIEVIEEVEEDLDSDIPMQDE